MCAAYLRASLVSATSSTVFCRGSVVDDVDEVAMVGAMVDVVLVFVLILASLVLAIVAPCSADVPSPSPPGSSASMSGTAKPLSSIVVAMHLSKSLLDVVVVSTVAVLEYEVVEAPAPPLPSPPSQQLSTAMHISERLATKSANTATCPHATSSWAQLQSSPRMVMLSKLTQVRRVHAPSLGSAPDGQQSLKSMPEARQRIEDCNVRSIEASLALALELEALPGATAAARTTEMSRLKSMVVGTIMDR